MAANLVTSLAAGPRVNVRAAPPRYIRKRTMACQFGHAFDFLCVIAAMNERFGHGRKEQIAAIDTVGIHIEVVDDLESTRGICGPCKP